MEVSIYYAYRSCGYGLYETVNFTAFYYMTNNNNKQVVSLIEFIDKCIHHDNIGIASSTAHVEFYIFASTSKHRLRRSTLSLRYCNLPETKPRLNTKWYGKILYTLVLSWKISCTNFQCHYLFSCEVKASQTLPIMLPFSWTPVTSRPISQM